jgi:chitin disaccharide deacetylase
MKLLTALLFLLMIAATVQSAEKRSLAERLGYSGTDKLLIVNGDDAGMCHPANMATIDAMEKGAMRTSTIMVPCPWFPEIASYAKEHPDKDFGIHLCHTSEWTRYRWGSVAPSDQVPSLLDPAGYLWQQVEDVYAHGKPEEALIEGRTQIKRALAAGVDVTHIDSHMGTLQLDPGFLKIYLQLAVEFNLPVRMAGQETLERFGHPEVRQLFAAKGIVFPDHFVYEELKNEKSGVKDFWMGVVKNLKPGVTELYIHAALLTDELKVITGTAAIRAQEYEVFTNDPDMKKLLADQHIKLIGYRPLRELQRKEHPQ